MVQIWSKQDELTKLHRREHGPLELLGEARVQLAHLALLAPDRLGIGQRGL